MLVGTFSKIEQDESVFAGPYTFCKTLGKGTTGKVKLAEHKQTNDKTAIKIIRKASLENNDDARHRVQREIGILKLLKHQNIMRVYDIMQTKNHLFIVLEYLSGGELYDYVVQKGKLENEELFQFFFQLVMGVEYMHSRNICHRDLKLENLLLDGDGHVKVADFGMASTMPEDGILQTSCGSPHYACPEIVKGEPYVGTQADIWSIGVILFALATIKSAQFTFPKGVDEHLRDLITRMLQVNASQRLSVELIQQHPWWQKNFIGLAPQLKVQWEQQRGLVHELKLKRAEKLERRHSRNKALQEHAAQQEQSSWGHGVSRRSSHPVTSTRRQTVISPPPAGTTHSPNTAGCSPTAISPTVRGHGHIHSHTPTNTRPTSPSINHHTSASSNGHHHHQHTINSVQSPPQSPVQQMSGTVSPQRHRVASPPPSGTPTRPISPAVVRKVPSPSPPMPAHRHSPMSPGAVHAQPTQASSARWAANQHQLQALQQRRCSAPANVTHRRPFH
eukprot:TRINITY_DN63394_c0_g1_i2.p1 TRINITY_DN63394_c0_g1~~TRINITY_DN63394_c0_g1_i2.p1  ORF type:complete len:504 (+),score=62.84 TRINITY_DN63394_c0_g1_i2:40-1551(+)